jgi:alanine dehydrogenase
MQYFKTLAFFLLGLSISGFSFFSTAVAQQNQNKANPKYKLILGIVVDQLRYDYLDRFERMFLPVGENAARIAAGFGANVTILDINPQRMHDLESILPPNVKTQYNADSTLKSLVTKADLVIGAALIPGKKAPKLISREMLKTMKKGSVLVDVAIDQGGCFETSHPTTHDKPTYIVDDVVHYAVANMPGAVSRTSTLALNQVLLPYAVDLANLGVKGFLAKSSGHEKALNMRDGKLTLNELRETFPYLT